LGGFFFSYEKNKGREGGENIFLYKGMEKKPPKPSCRHKAAPINGLPVTVREALLA
jgi:hypothetical protein